MLKFFYATYSTEEIVQGIKDRDINIFKYLNKKFRKKVIVHVQKNNSENPQQDGGDLYNEAIIEAMRVIDKESEYVTNFGGFFYTIYQRKWLKVLKKREKDPSPRSDWWDVPAEEDVNVEELKLFYSYFPRLTTDCQKILHLTIQGYNQKEIAEKLDINYDTLRKRKSRCIKTLKELVENDIK